MVTQVDRHLQNVEVNVAGDIGVIPLAAMRWARAPNAATRLEWDYLRDVAKALQVGDVVWVKPIRAEDILEHPFVPELKEQIVESGQLFALEQEPNAQAALVVVEPQSGYVMAEVGGYDFDVSTFNRATQACREPGSAFKPIVYSAAISKLDYTASTLIDDKPLVFEASDHSMRWKPNNAGHRFLGSIPLRTCLKDSINVPAIRIASAVGIDGVLENARALGLTTPLKRELGTVLGSSCTTLLDLSGVYATLARYGEKIPTQMIRSVRDRFGNLILLQGAASDPVLSLEGAIEATLREAETPRETAMDPQSAFLTVKLLQNVVEEGTAVAAKGMSEAIAGKTGTTNDSFDAWFIGFTPKLLAGVWVGYDTKEYPLGMGEYGGSTALPLWKYFMRSVLFDYQEEKKISHGPFAVPEGIVSASIDPETGLLARPESEHRVVEYYKEGHEPLEYTADKNLLDAEEINVFEADSSSF